MFDKYDVKTEAGGYDLYIQEPEFDSSKEELVEHWTSKKIELPSEVERRVNRNSTELPCTKIYEDPEKRKRLYTYFD